MTTKRFFSGSSWEPKVGYARAVRKGNFIAVSGTAPVGDDGKIAGLNDPFTQTQRCFVIIQKALKELGGDLSDIVRTRIFVADMNHWEDIGRAHAQAVGAFPPATSLVQVAMIDPHILVEIEADAIVGE
ncbi:MAG: RidA family protein [Deltaproteobacteria bacterium]|nr:RidA family protein [Deltaproteobacteria bacterium]